MSYNSDSEEESFGARRPQLGRSSSVPDYRPKPKGANCGHPGAIDDPNAAGREGATPGADAPSGGPGWAHCEGYSRYAPSATKVAECARIRQKEEAASQEWSRRKRQEAERIISQSTGGQLGTSGAGRTSMYDARKALLDGLEREAKPSTKRAQRLENHKKYQASQDQLREAEEEKRQREWIDRERKQAERASTLNHIKRQHWQSWESGVGGAGASSAASAAIEPVARNAIVGKWLYGQREYVIEAERGSRQVRFVGPGPSGGRMTGILHRCVGSVYEARLTSSDGAAFGTMQFRIVQDSFGSVSLVTQFRKEGSNEWGRENFARKACAEAATSPAGAAAKSSPLVEAWQAVPLAHLGTWECLNCTLINDGTAVCVVCDAPRSYGGKTASGAASMAASAADPSAVARPGPEVRSGHSMNRNAAAATVPGELLAWLQKHRLEQYAGALELYGFEELSDLRDMGETDLKGVLNGVLALIGMTPEHSERLLRGLREPRAANDGLRECPVCLEEKVTNVGLIPCGHVFCAMCAERAVEKGCCPMCRCATRSTQRFFLS